jgi:hypothetical protein
MNEQEWKEREEKALECLRKKTDKALKLVFKDKENGTLNTLNDKDRATVKSLILEMTENARRERVPLRTKELDSSPSYFQCIMGVAGAATFGNDSDPEVLELSATLERIDKAIPKH